MKFLIASDIHGSAYYCRLLLDAFKKENADKILLLGDILYHGPRNDLPKEYAPKDVIAMLNPIADKILCVRGNCDTEVDGMVLDFPVLATYAIITSGDKVIYATHGHVFNEDNLPSKAFSGILLCGHTHVPKISQHEKYTYLNSGSVSIPKENTPHSYVILEDGIFTWKNLENVEVFMSL